jgi:SAM-dependent methyltransferase
MNVNEQNVEETFKLLADIAHEKTPFFADIWERSRNEFGDPWVKEIVDNVVKVFGSLENTDSWEGAIRGYAEFALDAMRNQKFFEANGHYRWSTLKEIQGRYYDNEDHMMKGYLPGMYLSHYLWPHHFKLLEFFRKEVLSGLAPPPALFYDVGIGSGMYSREVLRGVPNVRGVGFDVSPYSVEFTSNVLQAYGLQDRYEFVLGDIFTSELPWKTADLVVSQEVLEHLEEPERFTRILYRLTKAGGKAYITAAVNAGHSDHIYLFRSPEEVKTLLTKVGWKIIKWRAEYGYTGAPIEVTPCIAHFLCER